MSGSSRLFSFTFTSALTHREFDLLRELGFSLTAGKPGHEEAEAALGDYAEMYLSAGDEPGTWTIEAVGTVGKPVDGDLVARRRASLRELLPRIATTWIENPGG